MYIYRCNEFEHNCDWEEIADTRSELMIYIKEHLQDDHGINHITEDLEKKAKLLIDEYDDFEDDWDW